MAKFIAYYGNDQKVVEASSSYDAVKQGRVWYRVLRNLPKSKEHMVHVQLVEDTSGKTVEVSTQFA